MDLVATDAAGDPWFFDVPGAFTSYRGGLLRSDTVWRSLGRASALRAARGDVPLVFLATDLPKRPGEGDTALRAAGPDTVFDVIGLRSVDDVARLARYACGRARRSPLPGFWTPGELAPRLP